MITMTPAGPFNRALMALNSGMWGIFEGSWGVWEGTLGNSITSCSDPSLRLEGFGFFISFESPEPKMCVLKIKNPD